MLSLFVGFLTFWFFTVVGYCETSDHEDIPTGKTLEDLRMWRRKVFLILLVLKRKLEIATNFIEGTCTVKDLDEIFQEFEQTAPADMRLTKMTIQHIEEILDICVEDKRVQKIINNGVNHYRANLENVAFLPNFPNVQ